MDAQIEKLKDILDFNPTTGLFTWRVRMSQKIKQGSPAGWRDCNGYIKITIFGKRHRAHRLAWAIHYGEWPSSMIDHINGNGEDNRICNLRLTTHQGNLQNIRKSYSGSEVESLGVHMDGKKYRAQIRVGAQRINLGSFNTEEDARKAYITAKRKYHKTCSI